MYWTLWKKIWRSGIWPLDWKRAVFIPLPKKGDPQECSNYRTISLISHASKILLKIIMKRIRNKLEIEVSRAQAGFRKGRGTRDHILNLKLLIQKCREFNSELRICFIDYSEAFDCVSHRLLWTTLTKLGFDCKIISLIRNLYDGQEGHSTENRPNKTYGCLCCFSTFM